MINRAASDFLAVAGLAALAFSRPLLAMFESQPEGLIAHDIVGARAAIFAAVVGFGVPIVLAAFNGSIGRLWKRARRPITFATVAALSVLVTAQVVSRLFPNISVSAFVTVCFGAGGLVALLHLTRSGFRSFLNLMSLGVLVFPLNFAFLSPAKSLIFDKRDVDQAPAYGRLSQKPVVVLVFDEFPTSVLMDEDLKIDVGRFPNFGRLAEVSTWYRYATTNSEATVGSIPTMLTGMMPDPQERRLPIASQYLLTLFDALAESHEMHVYESVTQLCRPSVCGQHAGTSAIDTAAIRDLWILYQYVVLPESLRGDLPSLQGRWSGFGNDTPDTKPSEPKTPKDLLATARFGSRQTQFIDFVEAMSDFGSGTLHYLHILLPHAPYYYDHRGKTYALPDARGILGEMEDGDPRASQPHEWHPDQAAADHALQRLMLQVGAVDRLLGRALDKLATLSLLDDALIVVAGDHGASYSVPGSRREIGQTHFAAVAGIPLFVKLPKQTEGRISNAPAQLRDVFPTVLQALGGSTKSLNIAGVALDAVEGRQDRDPVVFNDGYRSFSKPFPEFQRELTSLVREKRQLFPGGSWTAVFGAGRSAMLGKAVEQYQDSGDRSFEASLLQPELWDDVNLSGPFVPTLVRGRVLSAHDGTLELAVSANGRIAGFARPFRFDDARNEFAALIDPDLLTDGRNEVSVFRLVEGQNRPRLIPSVQETSSDYVLTKRNDELYLSTDSGDTAVGTGPPWGEAHISRSDENGITIARGWAGDTMSGRPASTALLFNGARLVARSTLGILSRTAGERFGFAELYRAGFELSAPSAYLDVSASAPIRVVAVDANGRAALIGYSEEPPLTVSRGIPYGTPPPYNFVHMLRGVAETVAEKETFRSLSVGAAASEPYLMGHWYRSSGGLRWAGREYAIAIPSLTTGSCIEIRVRPFVAPPELTEQIVNVYLDGEFVTQWKLKEASTMRVEISPREQGETKLRALSFRSTTAKRPVDLGRSGDVRELSLGFTSLTVADICPNS